MNTFTLEFDADDIAIAAGAVSRLADALDLGPFVMNGSAYETTESRRDWFSDNYDLVGGAIACMKVAAELVYKATTDCDVEISNFTFPEAGKEEHHDAQ